MSTHNDLDKLHVLLDNKDYDGVIGVLEQEHPADIADFLKAFDSDEIANILLRLPVGHQAQIFGYLDSDIQVSITGIIKRRDLVKIITNMSHDERADLFSKLSPEQQDALLPGLAQAEREDIRKLSSYPEGEVGSVMTSDYVTLDAGMSVDESLSHLRKAAPDAETIYQAYIVDKKRHLVGVVSLKDLIIATPKTKISDIMTHVPAHIGTREPREEAANLIADYDLMSLPVVNQEGALVGIVTYDDAADIIRQEVDEDFHKAGGAISDIGISLKDAGVALLYRKRIFWLVLLVFGNIFSGAGIAYFEDTIAAYIALVFFLPLLVDSGGNAGSQSATLMVRALATKDIVLKDWGRMLGKEVLIAALLGVTMALAVSSIGLWRGGPEIALVVSATMVTIVMVGSLIGMSLPFLLSRFKIDPAAASAPLVTSVADIAGVLIYFAIATAILDVPLPD